jgi:hypothetical protein
MQTRNREEKGAEKGKWRKENEKEGTEKRNLGSKGNHCTQKVVYSVHGGLPEAVRCIRSGIRCGEKTYRQ